MTVPTTYAIGTTVGGIAVLETLGVIEPRSSYTPYGVTFRKGDGILQGQGSSTAIWHWDEIYAAHRAVLRGLFSALSSACALRMPDNEGAWHVWEAVVDWPEAEEDQYATRTLDFNLKFSRMVIQAE